MNLSKVICGVIPWIKDVDQDVPAIDEPEAVNAAVAAAVVHDGDSDTLGWVFCCCCMIVAVELLQIKWIAATEGIGKSMK